MAIIVVYATVIGFQLESSSREVISTKEIANSAFIGLPVYWEYQKY